MPFRPTSPLFKKTSKSSTLWLARQYRDPYVKARLSNPVNYRSRSAFKLLEVESRFKFLNDFLKEAKRSAESSTKIKSKRVSQRTFNVVDLGAAPGGWSQVIAAKLGIAGEEAEDEERTRRKPPKRTSNMAEWKEEMSKRRRMGEIFDESVDDEIVEMQHLEETNDWSTPPSLKSKKKVGLDREAEEPNFNDMDPLDYLNSRDLEKTSSEQGPPLPINLVALDILPIRPLVGVHTVQMDFLSPQAPDALMTLFDQLNEARTGKAATPMHTGVDLILSDLSPPHTGNRTADVSHSVTLLRAVWDFARKTLKTRYDYHLERVRQVQWIRQDIEREHGLTGTGQDVKEAGLKEEIEKEVNEQLENVTGSQKGKSILRYGGILVIKHFAHPLSTSFYRVFLKPYFSKVHYFKPAASRTDSSEGYWVCIGWNGVPDSITMEFLEGRMQKAVEAEKLDRVKQKKDAATAKKITWEEGLKDEMDRDVEQAIETSVDADAAETLSGDASRPDSLLKLEGTETDPSVDNINAPDDHTHPESTIQQSLSNVGNDLHNDAKTAGSGSVRAVDSKLERGARNNSTQIVIDWRPKP